MKINKESINNKLEKEGYLLKDAVSVTPVKGNIEDVVLQLKGVSFQYEPNNEYIAEDLIKGIEWRSGDNLFIEKVGCFGSKLGSNTEIKKLEAYDIDTASYPYMEKINEIIDKVNQLTRLTK